MDKDAVNKIASHTIQTWDWGSFRAESGNEVVFTKYGLLTLHKIPFLPFKVGAFLKGPRPTKAMFADLKKLAKEKNLIFIKLEPNFVPKDEAEKNQLASLLRSEGCVPGKSFFTPTTFFKNLI